MPSLFVTRLRPMPSGCVDGSTAVCALQGAFSHEMQVSRGGGLGACAIRRLLLALALLYPLANEQHVHDDGEDEYENAADEQNVVQRVHCMILPASKRTTREALWQAEMT